MILKFRKGNIEDVKHLKLLAIKSWAIYESMLTPDNWKSLSMVLNNDKTYSELISNSECIICSTDNGQFVGMAFLVPSGNPTDIFDKEWSTIRFVSVDPEFGGLGIGRQLMVKCIDLAKFNNERTIALHTSEMMNKARHIYESLGFQILKEIDQRLGKRYWIYKLEI